MSAAAGPDIIENGLVLCLDAGNRKSYPGSGTVWRDLAGSNNGTLTNGPTFSSANGGSIIFDGVNDHVRVGAVTSATTTDVTYSIWFKTNSLASQRTLFWDDDSKPGGDAYVTINTNGTLSTTAQFGTLTTSSFITVNRWNNVTFVASGSSPRKAIYVNGVLNTSNDVAILSRFNISYITLGANFDGNIFISGGMYLNGEIAIFTVYNRSLTRAEILQNYNATKGRFKLI